MKFSKKVMSVALCTTLLSGGSLATFASIVHADSNNTMCSRSTQESWREELNIKLQRKSGFGTTNVKLNLVVANGKATLSSNYNTISSLYDYKFADDYVFGVKNSEGLCKTFKLDNSNIGAFSNGNVGQKIDQLMNDFNSSNVVIKDGLLTILYAHGVKYNDTLTFSGKDIKRPTTTKDYSKGYASRGIDKWTHGFQLTQTGIYECSFIHK